MNPIELLLSVRNDFTPPFVGSKFLILIALKNDDGSITDAGLDAFATVLKGTVAIAQYGNEFYITCTQLSEVIIQFTASYSGSAEFTNYYSFKTSLRKYTPQVNQYQALLNSEMPGDMFDDDALDSPVWAASITNIYNYIEETLKNIFPNLSNNIGWLQSLWSQTQPLFFNNPSFKYEDLFVFLRNLRVSCTLNPFDIAWHISYFCWVTTGNKTWVYVDENKNGGVSPPADYTVYIFGDTTGQWILDTSILDTDTILGGTTIYTANETSINFFVAKIYRIGRDYNVDYSETGASLGLTELIPNAYKGDVRLSRQYCISYNPNNFTLADGLINP